jgi:hypothetical protein
MPDRAKKRLEVLEHLRAELERVRAQADELHDRIISELHRVEADLDPGAASGSVVLAPRRRRRP